MADEVTVLPSHPEFAGTGLSTASRIRLTGLVTLSGTLLRRFLGRVGPLLILDIDQTSVSALGINTVPYREDGQADERRQLLALYRAGGSAALVADLVTING